MYLRSQTWVTPDTGILVICDRDNARGKNDGDEAPDVVGEASEVVVGAEEAERSVIDGGDGGGCGGDKGVREAAGCGFSSSLFCYLFSLAYSALCPFICVYSSAYLWCICKII